MALTVASGFVVEDLKAKVRDLEAALEHARQVAELERKARLRAEESARLAWSVAARA